MNDKLNLVDGASATLQCAVAAADKLEMRGFYLIECIDSEGNLKWNDEIRNIVTIGRQE
jgi:hypothetical protein